MLKEQPDNNNLQDSSGQEENKELHNSSKPVAPKGKKTCGCKKKKEMAKSKMLEDLHNKMKKTKYL